jgi:hypothetical protein
LLQLILEFDQVLPGDGFERCRVEDLGACLLEYRDSKLLVISGRGARCDRGFVKQLDSPFRTKLFLADRTC